MLALTVFALLVILGAAALTMDVGLLTAGVQRAQEVADAAAHGAGMCLPDATTGRIRAWNLVTANNDADTGLQAVVRCYVTDWDGTPTAGPDVVFYGPWDYVPDFGLLGHYARAVRVTAHVPVQFTFAKVLGFEGANPTRSCTVVRMPIGGVPICPMWISYEQEYLYGQEQQLLMAEDLVCQHPWFIRLVEPAFRRLGTFIELLSGYNTLRAVAHRQLGAARRYRERLHRPVRRPVGEGALHSSRRACTHGPLTMGPLDLRHILRLPQR